MGRVGKVTTRYRVVVVGTGKRGVHHAAAFAANPRFELSGIADSDQTRLDAAAAKFGSAKSGTDTQKLIEEVKPDVFCFCTPPNVRLPLIELGIKSGAKLIAFEKPVAMTSEEGMAIKRALDVSGVKAVVSHQHRYGDHYKKVKSIIASGAIGKVHTVYGTSTGWAAHMLSHLVDYTSWFNEYEPAEWVMGQAAGRGKLHDLHASPDYVAGVAHFRNGVRGVYDCGAGAPDVPEVPVLVAQVPHRCVGIRGLCRGSHRERMARGHQRRVAVRSRRDGLRPRHGAICPRDGGLVGR